MIAVEIAGAVVGLLLLLGIAANVARAADALARLAELTAGELNTRNMERAEWSNRQAAKMPVVVRRPS